MDPLTVAVVCIIVFAVAMVLTRGRLALDGAIINILYIVILVAVVVWFLRFLKVV